MKIDLVEFIDDGAFADVWKATDELGRTVAVKIIREATINVSNALEHARALARANHENVVKVYSIDKVIDPSTGKEVDGVVMEYINGVTLEKFLSENTLSIINLRTIGLGIIDGIGHIHDQGLTHGDLHEANIMVQGFQAKVIDILYLNSLATYSTTAKEIKFNRDLVSLRLILQQLMHKSELLETVAKEFNVKLDYKATVSQIRTIFFNITDNATYTSNEKTEDEIYNLLVEDGFIENEKYAIALFKESTNSVMLGVLKRLIQDLSYEDKHKHYVELAWKSLNSNEKREVLQSLSENLDIALTKGRWFPLIYLIHRIGSEGWNGLNERVRIKAEGVIIKDTLSGYIDIHGRNKLKSGALGTYAIILWQYFDETETLINNIISLLRQGWYSQNYIGTYFMPILYPLAVKTNKEMELFDALKIAVSNDAKIIKDNLSQLPEPWFKELSKQV